MLTCDWWPLLSFPLSFSTSLFFSLSVRHFFIEIWLDLPGKPLQCLLLYTHLAFPQNHKIWYKIGLKKWSFASRFAFFSPRICNGRATRCFETIFALVNVFYRYLDVRNQQQLSFYSMRQRIQVIWWHWLQFLS